MKTLRAGFPILVQLVLLLFFGQTASQGQAVRPPSVEIGANHPDVVEALAQICPRHDLTWTKEGSVSGCSVCPAGTAFQDERGESFQLQLRCATFGHFTSPQADNIILSFAGCEPHSTNFGGSFVFVLESGRPRLLAYNQALITEHCHRLSFPDGRDFLVCELHWGGQGTQWSYIYSVAFQLDGKSETKPIFTTEDTVETCGEDPEGKPTGVVLHSAIEKICFPDLNGDGKADISITATLGRKLLTDVERTACRRARAEFNEGRRGLEIPTQKYEINLILDGDHFKVAPASRATIKLFPVPQSPLSK